MIYGITRFLDTLDPLIHEEVGFPVRSGFKNITDKFDKANSALNTRFTQATADLNNKFNRDVTNDITSRGNVVKGEIVDVMSKEFARLAEVERLAKIAAEEARKAAEDAKKALDDAAKNVGSGASNVVNDIGGFFGSDGRIKKNIIPLDSSLEILRKMKPVRYQWKDCLREVYGFIAQDLKECLPTAVMTHKGVLHNIFQEASCKGSILTFTDFDTSELSYDKDKKLFPLNVDGDMLQILEILDDKRVRADKDLAPKVFVFGQEVDDFHTIDNHQIFTVTTSAVQELDEKVQRLEEENKVLHQQVSELFGLLKGTS